MKRLAILALLVIPHFVATAQNSCADRHKIFMVPASKTPKPISKLGTDPQFGPLRHLNSTDEMYSKLKAMGSTPRYQKEINDLFTALGYNGVNDPEFTEASITKGEVPFGAIGMLGYGHNKYEYSILVLPGQQNIICWKIAPKDNNGCDMYFMNECGNAFYYSNPPTAVVANISMNTAAPHYGAVNMKIKVYARYKHEVCGCCENYDSSMMTTAYDHNKRAYVEEKTLISEKEVDHIEASDDPTYTVKKVYIDVDKATYKRMKKHQHEEEGGTQRNYAMQ